jgi:hypothetical protein
MNALESTVARSTGTIVALDELSHVASQELGRMIYTLAGGIGKNRMMADTTMRRSYSWSTFVLLSAESSLEEKIRGEKGTWTAGMAVRIPDVDVTGVNRRVDKDTMARIAAIDTHFAMLVPRSSRALSTLVCTEVRVIFVMRSWVLPSGSPVKQTVSSSGLPWLSQFSTWPVIWHETLN